MKIALISDIHGNMEALESVFRDIEKQGVEKIHFLGDAVGYGCNPNKCIKKIDKYCEIKILGNHDYALMGLESTENFNQAAKASIDWTKDKVKRRNIALLADFEMEATFLDYHLVHSSPGHAEKWFYILDLEQAAQNFDNFSQNVCFVGHSHIPAIFKKDEDGDTVHQIKESIEINEDCKYIVNVGSVGQPRDNDSRACYLIADIDNSILRFQRVEYDIKKTQEKMRKADLPEFLIDRLAIGA